MYDISERKTMAQSAYELLEEVVEICEDNNLKYVLAPKIVFRYYKTNDFEENFTMPEIYMTLPDCLKFIEIVNKNNRADRCLDYMMTNERYPSFNVSYVDTTKTYINLTRGFDFKYFGMKVTINLVRNDVKKKHLAYYETGWEENSHRAKSRDRWQTNLVRFYIAQSHKIHKDNYTKRLFKHFTKYYSRNPESEFVFVRTYRKKRVYFPRQLFRETMDIEIFGKSYRIPKNYEDFIVPFYGVNWRYMDVPTYRYKNVIISDIIPYKDYINRLESIGITLSDVFDQQNTIRGEDIQNKSIVKSKTNAFNYAKRSGDRLYFYQSLMEDIDNIRKLRAEKNYAELNEIFKEYDLQVRAYLKNNLALCPCEELMEIECEILEHNGEGELAERLRSLTPEEHKKPIVVDGNEE